MKKLFLSLLLLAIISNFSFSQERWSTVKPPLGKYVKLPQTKVIWENPNTKTSYFNTPMGMLSVGANIRVLPNSNQQDEIYLAWNLQLPNLLFGSANTTVGSTYGQGMYASTNGGTNWYGTDLMPNMPSSTSDPAPAIDKNGNFVFTTLNTTGSAAFMIGARSTNFGVNWSTPYTIYSGSSDKNLSASDDWPASPYYGRSYTVWTKWSSPYPIMVSYTTDGGLTWSTAAQINNPSTTCQGADVCVGPGGVVYVIWSKQSSVSTGVGFAKSTDGGVTWTVNETAFAVTGMRADPFNGWGLRVNDFPRISVDKSGGPRNGWIYIVDCEKNSPPAGSDPDIVAHISSNGGTTWSAVKVNQDPINNTKVQFFPAVCVDPMGGVNVVYYDNRNYPSYGDSAETVVSRSIDGGATWTDIVVSDHRWKPAPEGGFGSYGGDYIGIAAAAGKVWPFWYDNKTGTMQAWTAPIELGPSINHTPLTNTELINGNRVVNCVINPAGSGINPSTVKLYYSKDNPVITTNVTMTNSGGNNWTANLPLSGAGLYRYYLTATDSLVRTATLPAGAPANYFQFIAATDTTKPVITHTPLLDQPKTSWPASVSATATDNIGVDSVWVKWYKNNTATGIKQFRLNFVSGSNYTGTFNSLNGDVIVGDSIFYRVFARDNSSMHNTDSTALYKFKIINLTTITIGSGTTSSNFPFTTYWKDGRTQYLYLASDLALMGTSALITKIGFDVISVGGPAMTDFKVSYKNTSLTTLSGFETGGFTVAYNPTSYAPSSTGWNMITMTNPINYTGGSLIIDICYNNTTYTAYSTVNSTPAPGMFWGRYNDLTEPNGGCDYTAWTLSTGPPGRANTRFEFTGPVGINTITTNIPDSYSLSQNYPNPFNPVTKINFALPKQGLVTLKIYDVLGREVKTLVNEVKQAGSFSVDFNASEFASGVYFYKFESGTFSEVKRMMLIK